MSVIQLNKSIFTESSNSLDQQMILPKKRNNALHQCIFGEQKIKDSKRLKRGNDCRLAQKKRVYFNLDKNSVHERFLTKADLQAAWNSDEENQIIMKSIASIAKNYHAQQLSRGTKVVVKNEVDEDIELSLRGIEQYLAPGLTKRKINKLLIHHHTIVLFSKMLRDDTQETADHLLSIDDTKKNIISIVTPSGSETNVFLSQEEMISTLSFQLSSSDVSDALVTAKSDASDAQGC